MIQKRLSRKQQAFINEYLKCSNATQAAIKAGYSKRSARGMGSENLTKPNIAEEISKRTKEMCMSADEALKLLAEQARGTLDDCMDVGEDGKVRLNFSKAKENGKLHLIKSIVPTANGIKVELYSSQRALELISKAHGLFTEKPEEDEQEAVKFSLPAIAIAPSFFGAYRDIISHNHTEYVFKGGRGSTKSSFTSEVIVELIMNNPEWHALVTRQVRDTIRDSVYSQIEWAINHLGVTDKFKCTTSPLEITYLPTKQKIYFRGADDPTKIKSIKPRFGAINILWFEELDQFRGPAAIRSIVQSAIRGGKEGYIFKSYNPPRSRSNWVYKELQIPKENRFIHDSDYTNVPPEWLGKTFIDEAEFLKEVNRPAYDHEYMGIATALGGLVFENVIIREITDGEIHGEKTGYGKRVGGFDNVLDGLDWGYFPDPAHYVKMHYNPAQLTLYIYDEYRAWRTSNKKLYEKLVERGLTSRDTIIADSAEPKSIADFRAYGASIRGAEKGPESVSYSMKWLQSLKAIVIDNKRAPFTAEEFLEYEHEVDNEGNYISDYPRTKDHAIAATRYATNLVWRRRGK